MSAVHVRALPFTEFESRLSGLNEVLIACVAGGASVSFMHPLSVDKASRFWREVAADVARRQRVVLVAEDERQNIIGTVQLITGQPENQPHRADVAKLLVHPQARRRGVAQRLMLALEAAALAAEKSVLVLDTATGSDAEMLYQNLGWQRVGELPKYALMPDGEFCSTSFYYRHI